MQKRDIILTAVFSTLAALITLAAALFVCHWCHKRKRKRDDDNEDSSHHLQHARCEGEEKKKGLNGFLNLKTPLISTKTLG